MKKYKMIEISLGNDSVGLKSTDSGTISWLIAEITKIVPTCKTRNIYKLPSSNDMYLCYLEKFQAADYYSAAWLIMKKLCEHGWEPWATSFSGGTSTYNFRCEENL
jgi:hypothetical protein